MSAIDRLEQVCFLLNIPLGGADGVPPSIAAYDTYYSTHVAPFLSACAALDDPDIKKVAQQCETSFQEQRKFLFATTACKKPDDESLMAFIDPLSKVIQKANLLPRKTKVLDHIKGWNEGIQACSWLLMPGGTAHINAQKDAAMFHLDKVLRYARDLSDEDAKAKHRAFVNTFKTMMVELAEYCTSFYKQGVTWKFDGQDVKEFKVVSGDSKAAVKSDADRLNAVTAALEAYAAKMSGGKGEDGAPPAVAAWQTLCNTELKAFLDACAGLKAAEVKLDEKTCSLWASTAYTQAGRIIEATFSSAKPTDEAFGELLGPISGAIGACSDPSRRDAMFDYIKGFNEVLTGLSWLCMPGGVDFIQSQLDASTLYTNKILKLAKEEEKKSESKGNAMKAFVTTLKALGVATKEYVNEWFKQGLTWRGKGPVNLSAGKAFPIAA